MAWEKKKRASFSAWLVSLPPPFHEPAFTTFRERERAQESGYLSEVPLPSTYTLSSSSSSSSSSLLPTNSNSPERRTASARRRRRRRRRRQQSPSVSEASAGRATITFYYIVKKNRLPRDDRCFSKFGFSLSLSLHLIATAWQDKKKTGSALRKKEKDQKEEDGRTTKQKTFAVTLLLPDLSFFQPASLCSVIFYEKRKEPRLVFRSLSLLPRLEKK